MYAVSAAVLSLPFCRRAWPFFGRGVRPHVRARHEVEDPAVEGGFVLQRDTEDLADDRHRNRIGVVVDHIERVAALGLHLIE